MANMVTDVTPVLVQAFPNGKPELSASDFAKARSFVEGRKRGAVPRPGPHSMDYAWWAHCMIVDWRMRDAEWEMKNQAVISANKAGIIVPSVRRPTDLICPECEVKCVLDLTANNVLLCPGGCQRAITVATFVALFQRPAAPSRNSISGAMGSASSGSKRAQGPVSPSSPPRKAGLSSTVPHGQKPEDYGIFEKPRKSRTPLVGWRMWNVKPWGADLAFNFPHLESLSNATTTSWMPMEPQRGTCDNKDPADITGHVCPSWEHRCGVHAVKEPSQIRKWGAPKVGPGSAYIRVLGEVDMWGRVLEYEEGYRAEWAYPKKMYLDTMIPDKFPGLTPEKLADELWMAYLTEVVVDGDLFEQFNVRSSGF